MNDEESNNNTKPVIKTRGNYISFLTGFFLCLLVCLLLCLDCLDKVLFVYRLGVFFVVGCIVEIMFPGKILLLFAGGIAGTALFVAIIFFKTPFALVYFVMIFMYYSASFVGTLIVFIARKFLLYIKK